MATQVQTTTRTQLNGAPRKPAAPRAAPVKKSAAATAAKRAPPSSAHKPAAHTHNKAASVAGENPASGGGVTSAYAIMASRIANRVAEMAESITFVERPKPSEAEPEPVEQEKRRPRKLEMRLNNSAADSVAFSAPFLDNTLQKMLQLQNRMLKTTAELSKSEGVDEKMVKEHAAQSAELSRIIALICAEKARQGA